MISTEDHLPKPYEWYEHQIAGHHPSVIKNGLRQIGIIKVPNTPVLLKVIQDDGRGSCEQQLYQDVKEAYENENVEGCVRALCKLHDLIPRYYGIHTIKIGKFHYQFMELEDISSTYCMPMVMDVKIGRVSYDPNATAEKRISEIKKCPFQIESGFRILGYRVDLFFSTLQFLVDFSFRIKIPAKSRKRIESGDVIDVKKTLMTVRFNCSYLNIAF